MLNMNEKEILELLKERHLMLKSELMHAMNGTSGECSDVTLSRLRDRGYVESVQNLGNCIVITKRGLQALKGQA